MAAIRTQLRGYSSVSERTLNIFQRLFDWSVCGNTNLAEWRLMMPGQESFWRPYLAFLPNINNSLRAIFPPNYTGHSSVIVSYGAFCAWALWSVEVSLPYLSSFGLKTAVSRTRDITYNIFPLHFLHHSWVTGRDGMDTSRGMEAIV